MYARYCNHYHRGFVRVLWLSFWTSWFNTACNPACQTTAQNSFGYRNTESKPLLKRKVELIAWNEIFITSTQKCQQDISSRIEFTSNHTVTRSINIAKMLYEHSSSAITTIFPTRYDYCQSHMRCWHMSQTGSLLMLGALIYTNIFSVFL